MSEHTRKAAEIIFSPSVLALQKEIKAKSLHHRKTMHVTGAKVEIMQGQDALWVLIQEAKGSGFALRTACTPGAPLDAPSILALEKGWEFGLDSALGQWRVRLETPADNQPLLRCRVSLTPKTNLFLEHWPRDLYSLGTNGDPTESAGIVHAAQRGLNSGLLYLSLEDSPFGGLLYFQNLTALNDYFEATGTIPDGRIGGHWPELGYALPTSEDKPLPAGQEILFSDAFLHWTEARPQDPRQSAHLFLDLLAGVYPHLERPESLYHDWPHRSEETLRDLDEAPEATLKHYGHRYLHPYTDAEYPDSMVQLTVLLPLREFSAWKGSPLPLADELRAGITRFFDPALGTIRRYLPNVGDDKDADEVDSWYLYHPMANMGRLTMEGDAPAKDLFLKSLEYGIKVAHHFHYQFPVQFNVSTLEVIKKTRKPGDPGQSDAGGLYAYVMLQAYEITGKERYLKEAEQAIKATKDMAFELEYQANITAWGANASLILWKITGNEFYKQQSEVFLASFFHNTLIWESQIGAAKHYSNFLGVTCLHDGPYMALYECYESFAAFHEYLTRGGQTFRLLCSFCSPSTSSMPSAGPGSIIRKSCPKKSWQKKFATAKSCVVSLFRWRICMRTGSRQGKSAKKSTAAGQLLHSRPARIIASITSLLYFSASIRFSISNTQRSPAYRSGYGV